MDERDNPYSPPEQSRGIGDAAPNRGPTRLWLLIGLPLALAAIAVIAFFLFRSLVCYYPTGLTSITD